MHPDYAPGEAKEWTGEWPDPEKSEGPVADQLMRLEKAVAELQHVAGTLEERVHTVLTPEQDRPEKASFDGGGVPQALHSPIAMALGTLVNKVDRVTKQIEGTRNRVEL